MYEWVEPATCTSNRSFSSLRHSSWDFGSLIERQQEEQSTSDDLFSKFHQILIHNCSGTLWSISRLISLSTRPSVSIGVQHSSLSYGRCDWLIAFWNLKEDIQNHLQFFKTILFMIYSHERILHSNSLNNTLKPFCSCSIHMREFYIATQEIILWNYVKLLRQML